KISRDRYVRDGQRICPQIQNSQILRWAGGPDLLGVEKLDFSRRNGCCSSCLLRNLYDHRVAVNTKDRTRGVKSRAVARCRATEKRLQCVENRKRINFGRFRIETYDLLFHT